MLIIILIISVCSRFNNQRGGIMVENNMEYVS
jgi:hypothetical protein